MEYDEYLGKDQPLTPKGTKWEKELEELSQELKRFNISLNNKNVLDISGELGF
jgi:hypothetical protein